MMFSDLSVVGIVFAVILFIVFFAAIILYLAFRVKETFREEQKRGMLAVKVGFLIGILFLAGGSFYFFAQVLTPDSQLPDGYVPDLPSDNSSSSNSTSPETPSNETENETPELALSVSYPATTKMGTTITLTFTITNPTEYTAHDAVIQTNELLQKFTVTSSTHTIVGNAIQIGNVSDTTICSLQLTAPDKPAQVDDTATLTFKEMDDSVTKPISISVAGGQQ